MASAVIDRKNLEISVPNEFGLDPYRFASMISFHLGLIREITADLWFERAEV